MILAFLFQLSILFNVLICDNNEKNNNSLLNHQRTKPQNKLVRFVAHNKYFFISFAFALLLARLKKHCNNNPSVNSQEGNNNFSNKTSNNIIDNNNIILNINNFQNQNDDLSVHSRGKKTSENSTNINVELLLRELQENKILFDCEKEEIVEKLVKNFSIKNNPYQFNENSKILSEILSLLNYIFFSPDAQRFIIVYSTAFAMLEEKVFTAYDNAKKTNNKSDLLENLIYILKLTLQKLNWDLETVNINKLILVTRLFFCEHGEGHPKRLKGINYNQQNSFWFQLPQQLISLFCQNNATNSEANLMYLDFLFDYIIPFTALYSEFYNYIDLNGKKIESFSNSDSVLSNHERKIKTYPAVKDNFFSAIDKITHFQSTNKYIKTKINDINSDLEEAIYHFHKYLNFFDSNKLDKITNKILPRLIPPKSFGMKYRENFYTLPASTNFRDLFFVDYSTIPDIIGSTIKTYIFDEDYIKKIDNILELLPSGCAEKSLSYAVYSIIRNADLILISLMEKHSNISLIYNLLEYLIIKKSASLNDCFSKICLNDWLNTKDWLNNTEELSIMSCVNQKCTDQALLGQCSMEIEKIKNLLYKNINDIVLHNIPLAIKTLFSINNGKIRGIDYTKNLILSNLNYLQILPQVCFVLKDWQIDLDSNPQLKTFVDDFLLESELYTHYSYAENDFNSKINIKTKSGNFRYEQMKNFVLYHIGTQKESLSNEINQSQSNLINFILKNALTSHNLTPNQKARLYSLCFYHSITMSVALEISKDFQDNTILDREKEIPLTLRMDAVLKWQKQGDIELFNLINDNLYDDTDQNNDELFPFIDIVDIAKTKDIKKIPQLIDKEVKRDSGITRFLTTMHLGNNIYAFNFAQISKINSLKKNFSHLATSK